MSTKTFPQSDQLRAELIARWEAVEQRGSVFANTEPIIQTTQTQVLAIVALIDATNANAASQDQLGQRMKALTVASVVVAVAGVFFAAVQLFLLAIKP